MDCQHGRTLLTGRDLTHPNSQRGLSQVVHILNLLQVEEVEVPPLRRDSGFRTSRRDLTRTCARCRSHTTRRLYGLHSASNNASDIATVLAMDRRASPAACRCTLRYTQHAPRGCQNRAGSSGRVLYCHDTTQCMHTRDTRAMQIRNMAPDRCYSRMAPSSASLVRVIQRTRSR